QPYLAAAFGRDIGAVHAVDDARQNKTRMGRIKLPAVEQLNIEIWADTDALIGKLGLVFRDVALEIVIERLPDRSHRRQREQFCVGQQNIRRAPGPHYTREREASMIELAQRQGIGDRVAALERRTIHRVRTKGAAKKKENSRPAHGGVHASTNTVQ